MLIAESAPMHSCRYSSSHFFNVGWLIVVSSDSFL
nr:MAG TPA: hypothetical protein [Caudoviricetes sp.]